ncbi:M15 family metallopeptidase [Herbaspirillum sp. GCM10030257]|uniref:M15 family metallopeptidase n=1 Tax=Herbaspirillum sp. GCM10030257 TaxID=3273393 RepID=UPI00360E4846
MLFFWLAAVYLPAIALAGWLVLPAERKTGIRKETDVLVMRTCAYASRISTLVWTGPIRAAGNCKRMAHAIRRRRRGALLFFSLLCIPALLVQWFAHRPDIGGYEDLPANNDPVVMALLQGEQLVPPPPLPPEAFSTREIESERVELASASREWSLLNPDFRQRLLTVFRLMENHGYKMALIEGYRSPERQNSLAKMGPHVTNAKAFQSYHQFGLAADNGFYRDGRLVISEKDPWAMTGYQLYGQYAESVGLTWGGHWTMRDFGHVELRDPAAKHHAQK